MFDFVAHYFRRLRPVDVVFWTFFLFNSVFVIAAVWIGLMLRRVIAESREYREVTRQYARLLVNFSRALERRLASDRVKIAREISNVDQKMKSEVVEAVATVVYEALVKQSPEPLQHPNEDDSGRISASDQVRGG